jgi:hypothetical protein
MEGLVDVPLSEVRIFRGRIARGVTQRLGADAVSAGPNVFFAPGEGNLASPSGRSLLAHELSHVAPSQDGATRPSEPDEERSALRLEHAVQRQESLDLTGPLQRAGASGTPRSLPSAPAPAAFGPAPLENRAARVAPPAPSFSAGVFGAPNASIAGAGAPPAVARAGRERSPASMEPAASEEEPAAEPDARAGDGAALGQEEQAGLVERTVEAVMRRLRRETDLERERRGAFRSEIGG